MSKLYPYSQSAIDTNELFFSLIEAFSKILKLFKIRHCLQAFHNGFTRNNVNRSNEYHTQHLASWIRNRMCEALKSLPKAYPQDAAALIRTANEYDENFFEGL